MPLRGRAGYALCMCISRQTACERRSGTREAFVASGVKEVIEARWTVDDAPTLDRARVSALREPQFRAMFASLASV